MKTSAGPSQKTEEQVSPSPSTVLEELSKGIIKDPFTFENKIHQECPTPPAFSDEKRTTVDRFWRDAYLKSLNNVLSHIQDWFTRISFKNKVAFARKAIQMMEESRKLFDLAYFIGPPTKDFVYAHTQFTRTPFDVAAVDHNRAIDDSAYSSQSPHYLEWFQSLNPREQFDTVVGLIHLGGAALEQDIYGQVVKILGEKERDVIRKKVLQYLAHKREIGAKVIASKVAKNKQKHYQPPKKKALSQAPKYSASEQVDDVDYVSQLQQKIAEYDNAIKNMENVAESHIDTKGKKLADRRKRSKSATPGFGKKSLHRLNAGLDRVQLLPLWDNRRIMALLPDKYSTNTMRVNKYWKDMVEKTKKEIKVRKKLEKVLKKMEGNEVKHGGGHKDDQRGHKVGKKHTESETRSQAKVEDLVPEDYHQHLDPQMVFTEVNPKVKPFSNTPQTYIICEEYCDDRAMDANKRWAVYSKKTDVEFCNVIYGVPCNMKLEGAHKMRISCVCFHPNDGSLVFTGGYDGLVKLHDVWKKSVKLVYAGHKGIVADVVVNCRYVASCGMDNTVRVFNISDGRSIMCVTMEDKISPCKLLMTNCAHPLLYVGNIHGEIVMYSVRDFDEPQIIGKTVSAHHGEVTSLEHYPCVLLSTGVDGFVRMWTTNFAKPFWILSLKHPVRVNSATMSHRKIVSASEDGKLRIWDVMSGTCEKVMNITPTGRPILSMRCIQCPNSVKFVLNSGADIRIVEFVVRKPAKKKVGRYTGSKLHPIGELKKKMSPLRPGISSYDKRMMKLQMRQAVLPTIRPSQKLPSPSVLQDLQKKYQLME